MIAFSFSRAHQVRCAVQWRCRGGRRGRGCPPPQACCSHICRRSGIAVAASLNTRRDTPRCAPARLQTHGQFRKAELSHCKPHADLPPSAPQSASPPATDMDGETASNSPASESIKPNP
eukprot:317098-Rhodomonas_salina.2